jgi:hypothetical protein
MSKQYHYVVLFDEKLKTWTIDFEVSINYDEGNVWDTQTQEWSYVESGEAEDIIIQELNEKLANTNAVNA